MPFSLVVPALGRDYLIKDLIPARGLTVVWGPPKSGKSFVTFDAMLHVALGWNYHGRRVRQGPVVYCAFEGGDGYGKRAEAFRHAHLAEDHGEIPFWLLAVQLDLAREANNLVAAIQAALGADSAPVAIVLDTLNRSLVGSECSDEDMAGYLRAADLLGETFRCAIIVVHHSGVNESRPRGHSSLTGAAVAQLAVRRDGENVVLRVEWMKDGPEGAEIAFRLKTVEVGTDEDGDMLTSCVVEAVEGASASMARHRTPRLTKAAHIALRALREALSEMGEPSPASNHVPSGITVTTLERWRQYAYSRGISASEAPRARQQAFRRAGEQLISAGEVVVWDSYVWTR
jgi:hypothetical protein